MGFDEMGWDGTVINPGQESPPQLPVQQQGPSGGLGQGQTDGHLQGLQVLARVLAGGR
jgi:hypothetical protein